MIYELDLIIDPHDLPLLLAAHMKLTIARQVNQETPQVIWQAFQPFEMNLVAWENEYGIYASSQPREQGSIITTNVAHQYPAHDNVLYTLDANGTFSESTNQPPGAGVFAVVNRIPPNKFPEMTLGLEQRAIINGNRTPPSPLNAMLVPPQSEARFIPQNILYVWMQAPYESGTIIDHVFERWTAVAFQGDTTKHTLKYNQDLGKFVIVNQ
ncbi:MAG TPA: hypothetical protein DCS93_21725 [Microscillaceae bacterium]|nr:hypothetical protein [Microscillaceae bacterium]